MKDLSIVIPVHNNEHFTRSCLLDLIELPMTHEIVVVDNGSTDHTPDVVKEISEYDYIGPEIKYIRNDTNLGFGKACNIGYLNSSGDNVMFLNNDVRVMSNHKNWTANVLEKCGQDSLVGINGGLLTPDFRFIRETNQMYSDPMFYLSGWCLSASRKVFDRLTLDGSVGPWNEAFFAYFEDGDLSWRAKEMGISFTMVTIPVHHFGRITSKKLNLSQMYLKSQATCRDMWQNKLVKQ